MDKLPTKAGGFNLVNPEKVDRALLGETLSSGGRAKGVIKEDGTWDDGELLAAYDKLGGLIRKNGDKVKTGSFYDFLNKRPRAVPKISFVFRINGKAIEVPDGVELPGIVKAAKIVEEEVEEEAEREAKEEAKPKRGRPAKVKENE